RLNTLFNTLVRDFLTVKEIVGDRFSGIEPDWVGYYVTNYLEFIQKERMGSGMDIRKLKELWLGGVSRLSKNQQEDVWRLVNRLGPRRTKFAGLRRWARKLGLVPFYSRTLGMLRRLRQGMEGKPVYRSVLEAAEKTDDVLAEPISKT
ncbi:MAG TPA: hypothetical protein VJ873_00825, partial [bacterium]|nr:hypothetical protein [bacterium]